HKEKLAKEVKRRGGRPVAPEACVCSTDLRLLGLSEKAGIPDSTSATHCSLPPCCKQHWAFEKTSTDSTNPFSEREPQSSPEESAPLCQPPCPQPRRRSLKYEINEVEFNFRVYKLVMCSSFLLPFCMAG
ncbi:hypothetical protein U0070_017722, partial [Myodes glareolus]